MPLYSKKDFADKCGMATKNLSKYIQRGKVIVQPDGMINDKVAENKLFLEKNKGKQSEAQLVKEFKKRIPVIEGANEDLPIDEQFKAALAKAANGEKPPRDIVESTAWLRHWDALKREKENEKLELDNQKKRGETLPTEVVQGLLYRHNQNVQTQFKNGAEEIIRMMGQKYGMTAAEMSEYRGILIQTINTFMVKAKEESEKGLKAIVEAYSAKRGVGERK